MLKIDRIQETCNTPSPREGHLIVARAAASASREKPNSMVHMPLIHTTDEASSSSALKKVVIRLYVQAILEPYGRINTDQYWCGPFLCSTSYRRLKRLVLDSDIDASILG
jgi:hypothetical protein